MKFTRNVANFPTTGCCALDPMVTGPGRCACKTKSVGPLVWLNMGQGSDQLKWDGSGQRISCPSSEGKSWPLKHDQEWESGNDLWLKDNQKGGKWRESVNEKILVELGEKGFVRVTIWKENLWDLGIYMPDSWKCDLDTSVLFRWKKFNSS